MPTPAKSVKSVCWKSRNRTVLSDWICSFVAIDDGSSEQQCRVERIEKNMESGSKQSVLRA